LCVPPGVVRAPAPGLLSVLSPGRVPGLAEVALAVALHERGDPVELLVGDAAERDQGLAQPVLLEVAGREHEAPVVEEDGLHHLPGADLEVAALTGRRELSEGLRYGRGREVGQHSTVRLTMPGGTTQPRAIAAPATGPPSPGGSSRSRRVTRGSRCPACAGSSRRPSGRSRLPRAGPGPGTRRR